MLFLKCPWSARISRWFLHVTAVEVFANTDTSRRKYHCIIEPCLDGLATRDVSFVVRSRSQRLGKTWESTTVNINCRFRQRAMSFTTWQYLFYISQACQDICYCEVCKFCCNERKRLVLAPAGPPASRKRSIRASIVIGPCGNLFSSCHRLDSFK